MASAYWPTAITKSRLLVAEGPDAYWFCIWATQAYGLTGIQVVNFGGNQELADRLELLKNITGFDLVESLAIIRDAEGDGTAALRSVCGALGRAGLPAPTKPCQIESGKPNVIGLPVPRSQRRWRSALLGHA